MKIIATSDWHLGNMFHGNDRLAEHRHFLSWLLAQIENQQPDALLVAGDIFDNGNPSAAAQEAYYEFIADASHACSTMQIIITAGNHDSAGRLEAPRALLTRHHVEVRGNIHRSWVKEGDKEMWKTNYDDLIIPLKGRNGDEAIVLAVPYLRNDVIQNASYSQGVNLFLAELTTRAKALHPDKPLIMMAHMYAKGADIAKNDASEKIIIGGQEEVNLEGWKEHPDYLTCGHIHKRQHIWDTDWARYSGSVLPMSFAETNYQHGVDLLTLTSDGKKKIEFLEYLPQHKLRVIPDDNSELSPKQVEALINLELQDKKEGKLGDDFEYVMLKVKIEKVNNDEIKALEETMSRKNAVLCKIQKIIPTIDLSTVTNSQQIKSIDDILDRNPLDTLREAFAVKHNREMSSQMEERISILLNSITKQELS